MATFCTESNSHQPPPAPNISQSICQVIMMSTGNSSDKAHQLREKQAAELENANKMEQQWLKRIANNKEHD
jgi:hypothetical protein